ncbi:MAG: hypothetical protein JXB48_21030 [Candidatus Latescibacteria bacterium]|nr:hypothetical protein [Candidatus Latescibacterota bacterium]
MKSMKLITGTIVFVMILIRAGMAFSQDTSTKAGDNPVTVAEILKNAKCPLTETQVQTLNDIDLSAGRETFRILFGLFDEKQLDALKSALGTRPGRNNGPDFPRYLYQVVVLNKAKCPLTEKQVEELKALPMERGSWERMNEILTEKQQDEMEKLRGDR